MIDRAIPESVSLRDQVCPEGIATSVPLCEKQTEMTCLLLRTSHPFAAICYKLAIDHGYHRFDKALHASFLEP